MCQLSTETKASKLLLSLLIRILWLIAWEEALRNNDAGNLDWRWSSEDVCCLEY